MCHLQRPPNKGLGQRARVSFDGPKRKKNNICHCWALSCLYGSNVGVSCTELSVLINPTRHESCMWVTTFVTVVQVLTVFFCFLSRVFCFLDTSTHCDCCVVVGNERTTQQRSRILYSHDRNVSSAAADVESIKHNCSR